MKFHGIYLETVCQLVRSYEENIKISSIGFGRAMEFVSFFFIFWLARRITSVKKEDKQILTKHLQHFLQKQSQNNCFFS